MAHLPASQGIPIPVRWAGWESDTYRLGRCGWDVAMEENFAHDELHVLLHHRQFRISGLGTCRDYRNLIYGRDACKRPMHPIEIQTMATEGQFRVMGDVMPLSDYRWRDTMPSHIICEDFELHTLPLFAELAKPRAEELIVEPADVSAMLEQIKRMQSPRMQEIRAAEARRERDQSSVRHFHASIISFKEAA